MLKVLKDYICFNTNLPFYDQFDLPDISDTIDFIGSGNADFFNFFVLRKGKKHWIKSTDDSIITCGNRYGSIL